MIGFAGRIADAGLVVGGEEAFRPISNKIIISNCMHITHNLPMIEAAEVGKDRPIGCMKQRYIQCKH